MTSWPSPPGAASHPIFSLLKTALACTTRPVRLLYANRDRDSVIFGDAIDALADDNTRAVRG